MLIKLTKLKPTLFYIITQKKDISALKNKVFFGLFKILIYTHLSLNDKAIKHAKVQIKINLNLYIN